MHIIFALAATLSLGPTTHTPRAVFVYGDSFSAASGEDLRHPSLWPNRLERLVGDPIHVENRSINGNSLVFETRCFGKPAIQRARDELSDLMPGTTLVVMAGVNDTIQPNLPAGFSTCFDPTKLTAVAMVAALAKLRDEAKGHRLLVATIAPFGNSEFHSDAAERVRRDYNAWLVANWPPSNLIRLDLILADDATPGDLAARYDSGDGLHPNEDGAARIAATVSELLK